MVAEWKEFLWDVPQERAALWGYCQALFVRYSFPTLQVILLTASANILMINMFKKHLFNQEILTM